MVALRVALKPLSPPLSLVPSAPLADASDAALSLPEAFARFNRELTLYASRHLRGNRELGNDCAQDVWLSMSKSHNRRALEALPTLAAQRRYLFHCLNNRLRDHFRQIRHVALASAMPLSLLDEWLERDQERALLDHSPAGRNPCDLLVTRELLEALAEALRAKPFKPWQRETLGLLLAGYTAPQVVATLKTRHGDAGPALSTTKRFSAEMTRWLATFKAAARD